MGERTQWESCEKWTEHETAVTLTEPLGPLLHSFQSPMCSVWPCVCVFRHCPSHSLDSLEEAYSVVDLVRYFAENVFQSSGLLVQVLELLLGPVNHELCKTKRKSSLARCHKFKMCDWDSSQDTCTPTAGVDAVAGRTNKNNCPHFNYSITRCLRCRTYVFCKKRGGKTRCFSACWQ